MKILIENNSKILSYKYIGLTIDNYLKEKDNSKIYYDIFEIDNCLFQVKVERKKRYIKFIFTEKRWRTRYDNQYIRTNVSCK